MIIVMPGSVLLESMCAVACSALAASFRRQSRWRTLYVPCRHTHQNRCHLRAGWSFPKLAYGSQNVRFSTKERSNSGRMASVWTAPRSGMAFALWHCRRAGLRVNGQPLTLHGGRVTSGSESDALAWRKRLESSPRRCHRRHCRYLGPCGSLRLSCHRTAVRP